MSSEKGGIGAAWVVVAVAGMILAGSGGVSPPPQRKSMAEALERTFRHVEAMAVKPHPCGTEENARVREYIVTQLRSLGLEVEVQSTTAFAPEDGSSATLHNVVARLPGSGSGKAVLVAAHYDTKPAAPGAGDDAAGVAAILETARQLSSGERPRNPVIFLVTDGEEDGLLGAHAFVDEHPWAKTVGVAFNFEARGVTGPSLLFETSADNEAMVRELAALAPDPRGTSLAYEVYKHLPNDTDFTVFKKAGYSGLNFAFHDGWNFYHTPYDDPAHLDRRSLEQHLSTMLALTRRFASVDLPLPSAGDAVYFDLAGWTFLVYPASWIQPLAYLAALLTLAVMGVGMRTGILHPLGVGMSAALGLLALIGARFIGLTLPILLAKLHADWLPPGDILRSGAWASFLAATTFTFVTSVMALGGPRARGLEGATGALVLWTLVQLGIAAKLPGGSYLFTWPTLALAAGLAFALRRGGPPSRPGDFLVQVLLALPGVTLLTATTILIFVSMGLSKLGAPLVAIVTGLTTLHALLVVTPVTTTRPLLAPILGLVAMAGTFVHAARVTRHDPQAPRAENVHYMLDARGRLAQWGTMGPEGDIERAKVEVDRFLDQLTDPEAAPMGKPAKILAIPGPTVEAKELSRSGTSRILQLLVKSPRGARELSLSFPAGEVRLLRLQGKLYPGTGGTSWHHHFAVPPAGLELEIEVPGLAPIDLLVADWSSDLPAGEVGIPPRLATSMPGRFGDRTLVVDRLSL